MLIPQANLSGISDVMNERVLTFRQSVENHTTEIRYVIN